MIILRLDLVPRFITYKVFRRAIAIIYQLVVSTLVIKLKT